MGAAQSTVLEAVELEFHRLARKKRYLTLQEVVLMRCTYGVDLTHIGVLYRMDEHADGRFTLDELRVFATAAYSTVSVGFRRGGGNGNGNGTSGGGAAAGKRPPPLRAATTGGGGGAASMPPVVPLLGALSCGGSGTASSASAAAASLGWSGPEAMPGLHRHATLPLVPAHCSLHLWRRTRSPQGRRAFLRWAARLFSEGGNAVVPMARADAQAAAMAGGSTGQNGGASASSSSSSSVVAMVREEALMGVHELFDLQRAHGLSFESWLALLRAAAAEGARNSRGGEADDAEDDAALLRQACSPSKRGKSKGARNRRRNRRVGRSDASHKEEDDGDDDYDEDEDEDSGDLFCPTAAAAAQPTAPAAGRHHPRPLVPLSVLRLFAASVLDGAVGVADGWFDPADLEPGGRVARATNSALLLSADEREGEGGWGAGAAAAAEAAAAAAARGGGGGGRASSPAKSHGSSAAAGRRSSAPPLIPALW